MPNFENFVSLIRVVCYLETTSTGKGAGDDLRGKGRLCCALQQSGFYTGELLRTAKEIMRYVEQDARGEGLHSINQLFGSEVKWLKPTGFSGTG